MKITKKLALMLKSMLSLHLGSVATDKAELFWDAEEDLREGMEVFVRGGDPEDNAEFQPAPDGDYTTEDGKIIKVVGGKVSEIIDPQAEVAQEEVQQEDVQQESVQQEENEEVPAADEPEVPAEEEPSVEDRIAAIEDRIAAFMDGLNQIVNGMAALEERLAVVEEKLAKVEEPAAEPADDNQPEVQQSKNIMSYLRKN